MIGTVEYISLFYLFIYKLKASLQQEVPVSGNLAEWLRRKIRNLLGSARAGSNPAVVAPF